MSRRFWVCLVLTAPLLLLAMGEMVVGPQAIARIFPWRLARLGPARARDAGGPLGRLAVLRARLGLARQPQPQHVHADRPRHRRGVCLQRGGDALPRHLPGLVPRPHRERPGLLRGRRGHHHARAARPGARAAGPEPDLERHQGPARPRPEDGQAARARTAARRTSRSRRSRSATASASGPARRCPSTAS